MGAQAEKMPIEQQKDENIDDENSLDFAAKLNKLERTVQQLEKGEISLEESLLAFEEGVRLARELEAVLSKADQRVKEILKAGREAEESGE